VFNIEDFDIRLDTDFIGRSFVYCEEINSTNSFLLNSSSLKENGTVVLAEFQEKGRGRQDRAWLSNTGQNLTFSIMLNEKLKANRLNIINLGTSLTIAQSIENLYQLRVNLKWPNDVLINNKKVAGILLESSSLGNKIEKLVIGIGINVNQPSFQGKFPILPTSIRKEFTEAVSRERLLSEFLNNFEEILETCSKNPQKILNDWKSKCEMIGEKIKVESDQISMYGIFEDLDSEGHLLLKVENKIEKIHFGDVSLRQ